MSPVLVTVAAWAATRHQGYLRSLYHRPPYHELGAGYFDRRLDPERETRRLIAKLEALGHQVTLDTPA